MIKKTEQRNLASKDLELKSIKEILETINSEDERITKAINDQLTRLEEAVKKIINTIKNGGNVILVGAGTSGRLCVLEAAELPPTFGLPPKRIRAIIAGGVKAIYSSVEDAEDDATKAALELEDLKLSKRDLVIGVSASGSTPYVISAIKKAKELNIRTVGLSCNSDSQLSKLVETPIEVIVGPEIVAGSTRMKAGTAQKMVLNMMTTTSMMKLGYIYDGYMVGVQATNDKLRDRSTRIVAEITGASIEESRHALEASNWDTRLALIHIVTGLSPEVAAEKLKSSSLRQIITQGGS
jgi:N-acetylmuramic acid 6-phosphate etherase